MARPEAIQLPEGIQFPLRGEGLTHVYVFKPGSYPIYPKFGYGYTGEPTELFVAEKIGKGIKIKGLTGYKSLTLIHLSHRGRDGNIYYQTLGRGTPFGAYPIQAHKIKL
jgi:hypothetical protein